LIFIPLTSISQNTKDTINNNITSENEDFSSAIVNISYTNNNLEYLTGATENIPTLFNTISYIHKSGFYAGGTYSNYFSDSIQSHEYTVGAGYQKYFENGFDIDLNYNMPKFSGDSLLMGLDYNHSLDLMFGYEIDKLYFSGDLASMFGETNNLFLNFSLSRSFQLNHIFFDNDICLINPTLSLSFGTDYWIYENMTSDDKSIIFSDLTQSGYSHENFSYEGLNIFFPVSYGINNIYITFSWLYRIPGNKYELIGWDNQSGIMLSLTYFFNFTKK
nr:hypothetical protein [Bacteroidales bacterium]